MRVGYAFWGFIGEGIVDTPDGGRSHRRVWLDALRKQGHTLVFLQRDRDREEAGQEIPCLGSWHSDLPDIDLLFLEWRWPIQGRNCGVAPGSPGYTPDLDRQTALVRHYTLDGTPTIIWDKDLQLPLGHALRELPHVAVAEAALHPRQNAHRLLFPVDDDDLTRLLAQPSAVCKPVEFEIVYVGNQYERDEAFDAFFARHASGLRHAVFGKWTDRGRWPNLDFRGRVAFREVAPIYARSACTVLLAPARYCQTGQFTQRIFEAAMNGCLPIAPATMRSANRVVPEWLIAGSETEVRALFQRAARLRTGTAYDDILRECLGKLQIFCVSRQLAQFAEICRSIGARDG